VRCQVMNAEDDHCEREAVRVICFEVGVTADHIRVNRAVGKNLRVSLACRGTQT
jgi:hypothetical protein